MSALLSTPSPTVCYVAVMGARVLHTVWTFTEQARCYADWHMDADGRYVALCPHYEVRWEAQRALWEETP